MNKNNFMPIVEKICSLPPSGLDRTEEDGKELLNLCQTLMDMVNIPSSAEIYEVPLMEDNQVAIYFFLEGDDEKEYCLNAGHWLDGTISMELEAYGKETNEHGIEMYAAFESLPLDYFVNHEKESRTMTETRKYFTIEEAINDIIDWLEGGYDGYYCDLHNAVFNTSYYIIGIYEAKEALK